MNSYLWTATSQKAKRDAEKQAANEKIDAIQFQPTIAKEEKRLARAKKEMEEQTKVGKVL